MKKRSTLASQGYKIASGIAIAGNAATFTLSVLDDHLPRRTKGIAGVASGVLGGSDTCGLTPAGAAYCWGANDHGQLGDGTTTRRTSPVPIAGRLSFAGVSSLSLLGLSAGASHTCGITLGGVAYCWGANSYGQLGKGTRTDSAVPVKVAGQP